MTTTHKFLFFICFFSFATAGFSATIPLNKEVETKITSNRAEYDAIKQVAVFSGNVHVARSDFQLWSEILIVELEKIPQASKNKLSKNMQTGKVSKITAEKNVIIKRDTSEAHADKATYTASKDEFKLEGSPWIKEKNNIIRGETIYHYLKTNKSVVNRGDINFSSLKNK